MKDERITLKFNSEDELNEFIQLKPLRAKFEIVPYTGDGIYVKVAKDTYIKVERAKNERQDKI